MNLNVRILAIAAYARKVETGDAEQLILRNYEKFVEGERNAFALEDWAIDWTTRVLSLAVALYGGFGAGFGGASAAVTIAFIASGVIGFLSSVGATTAYRKRRTRLSKVPGA